MNLKEEFYKKLDYDKIKINWNKNPIKMDLFLSFLNVEVKFIKEHLGSGTGWTKYENEEHKLEIGGGWVNQIEYLDSLQFGEKLHNPYNNYVSPFYMFDILTKEGQSFFIDYYSVDIDNIVESHKNKIKQLTEKLKLEKELKSRILEEINTLKAINN